MVWLLHADYVENQIPLQLIKAGFEVWLFVTMAAA